jgi:hypothetical protein
MACPQWGRSGFGGRGLAFMSVSIFPETFLQTSTCDHRDIFPMMTCEGPPPTDEEHRHKKYCQGTHKKTSIS